MSSLDDMRRELREKYERYRKNRVARFIDDFLVWADGLIEEWSIEEGVDKIPIILEDVSMIRELPKYIRPITLVYRAAIPGRVYPEKRPYIGVMDFYLEFLFSKALERKKTHLVWNRLKFGLAHEFGHYLDDIRRLAPLYEGKTWDELTLEEKERLVDQKWRGEAYAMSYAGEKTGKGYFTNLLEFSQITGMTIEEYEREIVDPMID